MIHKTPKPWGHELLWARADRYAGKVLFIRAGEALSLQYHQQKDETIYVQSGTLRLQIGEPGAALAEGKGGPLIERIMEPGESHHIPALTRHRFSAIEDATLFEVSTIELDDVVRLDDRYGRTGSSAP